MKEKMKYVLVWFWMVCVIAGVFVGCGHKQKKGDVYEERTYRSESNFDSEKSGKQEEVLSSDVSEKVGERTEREEYQGAKDPAVEIFDPGQEETKSQGNIDGAGEKLESEAIIEKTEILDSESSEAESLVSESSEPKSPGPQSSEPGNSESENSEPEAEPYYLTDEDKAAVIDQLVAMGKSYGLTYYPDVTESETWDSPTPIYEEELVMGRDYVISTMLEYTEGAFVLMQMEGCTGFALNIKEKPNTVTDAYYEVYVYWM